jgi:hypothetical protein
MPTVYYDPSYSAAAFAFPTARKARWIADSPAGDPIPGFTLERPETLTDEHLRQREELVFRWCREQGLPVAFVPAGGYVRPPRMHEARLVELHRLTLTAAARYAAPSAAPGQPGGRP